MKLRDVYCNKRLEICVIRVPGEEGRIEKVFKEVMAKNLAKDVNLQIQESG